MGKWRKPSVVLSLTLLLAAGCGKSGPAGSSEQNSAIPSARTNPVSMNKDDYPVFPDPDAAADASVPAEQGGKGFKGEGWETNTTFDFIGDPGAVKGGVLRDNIPDFPGTLRMEGPEWNSQLNYMIVSMAYEGLLNVHPTTLEYVPSLATHWQISPDKLTFRFRINPNARWSDGQPVTSDDVLASWQFYTDKGLQDPTMTTQYLKFEKPIAESKYLVRVKAKTLNWQNFLTFAGMIIFPAHVLKNVDGATYLRDYNFKLLPGTGPYVVNEQDIEKGKSVTIRRRKDYWAEKARANVGLNNFDEIREVVVRDQNLAFEMFKRGDLDYFFVNRSKQWVDEFNFDKVQRGLIEKRKVFSNNPQGIQGYAFNTRRPPFDDIRVRKAFTFLQNRELMIQKLFYNEYLPDNSFFPGSVYENPNNPKNPYDPDTALKLLGDAGWKDRDAQGRLTKGGSPLEVEILNSDKQFETVLTVYQDDLRKVGITVNLRLVTGETLFKLAVTDRQFQMAVFGWGGQVFPDPEEEYHSSLADVNNTNNITGFKDPQIDQIIEKYNKSFNQQERVALMKDLDLILANQYQYALHWYRPALRLAYWNKFGQPQGTLSRVGDYVSSPNNGPGLNQMWWIDPQKAQKLEQAMRDPSIKLQIQSVEDHHWQDYGKTEQQKQAENKNTP
jgi:microcin C transport system substrate-binding protein